MIKQPENLLIPVEIVVRELKKADIKSTAMKFFFLNIILVIGIVILVFQVVNLSDKVANNWKMINTKFNVDGTWDIDYSQNKKHFAYSKNTVESIIRKYTKYRYSKDPGTIKQYFGRAQHYMNNKTFNKFASEKGFFAANVIEETVACKNCQVFNVNAKKTFIYNEYNHFFGKKDGHKKVYQSNAYFDEEESRPDGTVIKVRRKLLNITWRIRTEKEQEKFLRSFKENEKEQEKLRGIIDLNPIGFIVVDEEVVGIEEK